MDFFTTMNTSVGGMAAQTIRMKVASENIANADSVEGADGNGPYRAQQVTFKSVLNRKTGAMNVAVDKISPDTSTPLVPVFDPKNPLADAKGFVLHPNVDLTTETINMKEAQRSYEANMTSFSTARSMALRAIEALR